MIVGRSDEPLAEGLKRKISNLCDVPIEAVVNARRRPQPLRDPARAPRGGPRRRRVPDPALRGHRPRPQRVGGPGRPDRDHRAHGPRRRHRQVREPARRLPVGGRGAASTAGSTTAATSRSTGSRRRRSRGCWPTAASHDLDGIVIPGGFGERGTEGKIAAAQYARENDIPCLGLCLGLQMMTIDYARNVLGLDRRQLERARPGHPAPGDRPDGRPSAASPTWAAPCGSAPTWPSSRRARRWPRPTARPSSPSATATATSSTPATGPGSTTAASPARACRPTAGSSSSSS